MTNRATADLKPFILNAKIPVVIILMNVISIMKMSKTPIFMFWNSDESVVRKNKIPTIIMSISRIIVTTAYVIVGLISLISAINDCNYKHGIN